jgi:hypothetical protein
MVANVSLGLSARRSTSQRVYFDGNVEDPGDGASSNRTLGPSAGVINSPQASPRGNDRISRQTRCPYDIRDGFLARRLTDTGRQRTGHRYIKCLDVTRRLHAMHCRFPGPGALFSEHLSYTWQLVPTQSGQADTTSCAGSASRMVVPCCTSMTQFCATLEHSL